jgi:hypothetical protein
MKSLFLIVATSLISLSSFAGVQSTDLAKLYDTGVDAKITDFPTLKEIASGQRQPLQTMDNGESFFVAVFGTDKQFFVAAKSVSDLNDVTQEMLEADMKERQVSKYSFREDHGQVILAQEIFGITYYTAFRVNGGAIVGKNFEVPVDTPSIGNPPVLKDDTYSLFLKQ